MRKCLGSRFLFCFFIRFESGRVIKGLCDAEWLEVEVQDTVPDKYQLKVVCYQNTTASIRSTQVVVTCENGDKLTLKVTQKVMGEFDDIHNVVTDQPSFAPVRSSTL